MEMMMGTMIEHYNGAKRERDECTAWAMLIGSPYSGGGGGVGELRSVLLMSGEASPTVYHQRSDGAKNYHYMPIALKPHLEAAIKARFGELLTEALRRQDEALKTLAAAAVKEHASLLEAAGLAA